MHASSNTLAPSITPARRAGCVDSAELFQHPLMEEPPSSSASVEGRRTYAVLSRQAQNICAGCPIVTDCLFRAIVEHDVSGYVAGTTARQRAAIRRQLRITVEPEDFDTLAGVVGRHRQVDHEEVVRLRNANPHDSLETIARRLGCSLSTVKRHLRRERSTPSPTQIAAPRPTPTQVLAAAAEVIGGASVRVAA